MQINIISYIKGDTAEGCRLRALDAVTVHSVSRVRNDRGFSLLAGNERIGSPLNLPFLEIGLLAAAYNITAIIPAVNRMTSKKCYV